MDTRLGLHHPTFSNLDGLLESKAVEGHAHTGHWLLNISDPHMTLAPTHTQTCTYDTGSTYTTHM